MFSSIYSNCPDISELQEQDGCEGDRRVVSPSGGGEDQETGHQVPTWLQCPEWSGECSRSIFKTLTGCQKKGSRRFKAHL